MNLIEKLDSENCIKQFQETQGESGECAICGSATERVIAAWETYSEKYVIDIFRLCDKCRADLSVEELNAALARRPDKAFGFEVDRTSKAS
jgi:hypothetical protein